jgi:hypothetical protein
MRSICLASAIFLSLSFGSTDHALGQEATPELHGELQGELRGDCASIFLFLESLGNSSPADISPADIVSAEDPLEAPPPNAPDLETTPPGESSPEGSSSGDLAATDSVPDSAPSSASGSEPDTAPESGPSARSCVEHFQDPDGVKTFTQIITGDLGQGTPPDLCQSDNTAAVQAIEEFRNMTNGGGGDINFLAVIGLLGAFAQAGACPPGTDGGG